MCIRIIKLRASFIQNIKFYYRSTRIFFLNKKLFSMKLIVAIFLVVVWVVISPSGSYFIFISHCVCLWLYARAHAMSSSAMNTQWTKKLSRSLILSLSLPSSFPLWDNVLSALCVYESFTCLSFMQIQRYGDQAAKWIWIIFRLAWMREKCRTQRRTVVADARAHVRVISFRRVSAWSTSDWRGWISNLFVARASCNVWTTAYNL